VLRAWRSVFLGIDVADLTISLSERLRHMVRAQTVATIRPARAIARAQWISL